MLSLDSVQMALNPPVAGIEPVDGWLQRLQELPGVFFGVFGSYGGLGWMDTAMRPLTWVLAGSAFAMAFFWGLRRCGWRKAVSLVTVFTVGSAVVLVTTTLRHTMTEILQPRYFLPLIVMAVMIALVMDNEEGSELGRAQGVLLTGMLGVAHANALHTNLRRYLTGVDDARFNLNLGVEWWWTGAPEPMWVFAIGSLGFLGAAAVATHTRHLPKEPSQTSIAGHSLSGSPRPSGKRFTV